MYVGNLYKFKPRLVQHGGKSAFELLINLVVGYCVAALAYELAAALYAASVLKALHEFVKYVLLQLIQELYPKLRLAAAQPVWILFMEILKVCNHIVSHLIPIGCVHKIDILLHGEGSDKALPGKLFHLGHGLLGGKAGELCHLRRGYGGIAVLFDYELYHIPVAALLLDGHLGYSPFVKPLLLCGVGLYDNAAADGLHGRIKAHYEPVPTAYGYLPLKAELGKAALTRAYFVLIQQHRAAQHLAGAGKKVQAGAVVYHPV